MILVAASVMTAFLTGCWSYRAGEFELPRPTAISKVDERGWPSRDLGPVWALHARTPDVVPMWVIAEGSLPEQLSDEEKSRLDERKYAISYKGMHGLGLLRRVERLPKRVEGAPRGLDEILDFLTTGFTPNAYWLTSRTLDGVQQYRDRQAMLYDPERDNVRIEFPPDLTADSPVERLATNPLLQDLGLQQGMSIRLPPAASEGKKYVGVVLHLNAMFGNEYEVRTLEEFTRRGWAVIDLKPTSQVTSPIPQAWQERAKQITREQTVLMVKICTEIGGGPVLKPKTMAEFQSLSRQYTNHPLMAEMTKLSEELAAINRGAFVAAALEDAPRVGRELADEIDQAQAGSAYATEAVLDYIKTQREDLKDIPVVVIGFSGGALTTPTVAARILDQISAVVIIGGAADCFTASQLSTFNNGGLNIRTTLDDPKTPAPVKPELLAAISREYLAASSLDPYHTAPLLREKPVLFVAGSSDTWVPAQCGDLLYERLGKPDRLMISAGHELLFFFLPSKAPFIADWVEQHALHTASNTKTNTATE
jgi:dienelactone hydrolase